MGRGDSKRFYNLNWVQNSKFTNLIRISPWLSSLKCEFALILTRAYARVTRLRGYVVTYSISSLILCISIKLLACFKPVLKAAVNNTTSLSWMSLSEIYALNRIIIAYIHEAISL